MDDFELDELLDEMEEHAGMLHEDSDGDSDDDSDCDGPLELKSTEKNRENGQRKLADAIATTETDRMRRLLGDESGPSEKKSNEGNQDVEMGIENIDAALDELFGNEELNGISGNTRNSEKRGVFSNDFSNDFSNEISVNVLSPRNVDDGFETRRAKRCGGDSLMEIDVPKRSRISKNGGKRGDSKNTARASRHEEFDRRIREFRAENSGENSRKNARKKGKKVYLPRKSVTEIDGRAFTVTTASGERVFIGFKKERREKKKKSEFRVEEMFSEPIEEIVRRCREERVEKSLKEAEKLAASLDMDDTVEPETSTQTNFNQHTENERSTSSNPESRLPWAHKYAPKNFLGLLTDDKLNREVLQWLKAWDPFVFKKPPPPPPAQNPNFPPNLNSKNKFFNSQITLDSFGRPSPRVILLSGDPGVCKTTLAEILAVHCGYRPLLINASDERTGPVLEEKIKGAMDANEYKRNVFFKKRKPECIILDEVDGMAAGGEEQSAIQTILKMVKAGDDESGTENNNEAKSEKMGDKKKKKGKNKKPKILSLPMICICNDAYAPVLRPLRDYAKIFKVQPPKNERLVVRLKEICAKEKVEADKVVLNALVEKSRGDVRLCVNTLQSLACTSRRIHMDLIKNSNIACRDFEESVFNIWDTLFFHNTATTTQSFPTPKNQKNPKNRKKSKNTQNSFKEMCDMLMDFGNMDLISLGVYANYLNVPFSDFNMRKTGRIIECLAKADVLNGGGNFQYQQHVAVNLLGATIGLQPFEKVKLTWPNDAFNANRKRSSNQYLIKMWQKGVSSKMFPFIHTNDAAQDIIPAVKRLTIPRNVRPLPLSKQHPHAKKSLYDNAQILVSCGLSLDADDFNEETSRRGQMPLKPAIDTLHNYYIAQRVPDMVTSLLRSEVQRQKSKKFRRGGDEAAGHDDHDPMAVCEEGVISGALNYSTHVNAQGLANQGWATGVMDVSVNVRPCYEDWFKRVRQEKREFRDKMFRGLDKKRGKGTWLDEMQVAKQAKDDQLVIRKPRVDYKFDEGKSNAVKNVLYMNDLLQDGAQ